MKIKFIPSSKNDEKNQYFWAKYGDRFIGCYWLTESDRWLVQVWNSSQETEIVASSSEAIALIAKSWVGIIKKQEI